jgi:hypothetical protein
VVAVVVISQGLVANDWIAPLKRPLAEVRVTAPLRIKYCPIAPADMTLTPAHDDAAMWALFNAEQKLTACPGPAK